MTELLVGSFAQLVGGTAQGFEPGAKFKGFALDNREVCPGELFVAIKGSRVDGHKFAQAAVRSGAAGVLAERPVEVPYVLVKDVVQALADYAAQIRSPFSGPVIGITGSAGKTTTKEFVASALSPLGAVLKTEGNRNSEFSSPLLWAELTEVHKAVVVEMGMRGFGQIKHLASFSRPTIGVITNIGYSHIELVGSREGVAQAKAELLEALPPDGHAALWAEDSYLETLSRASKAPVATYGFSSSANCQISRYEGLSWRSCRIDGKVFGEGFSAILPASGRHMGLNAAAAILVASLCGVKAPDAAFALECAVRPPLRMEVLEHGGATILLDTYNASPSSVIAALETLSEMPVAGRRLAVLGDMRELGEYSEEGHREVGRTLARLGFQEVVLFGETARWIGEEAVAQGMPQEVIRQASCLSEVSAVVQAVRPGDALLIKGSRALELEKALDFLKESVR